MTAPMEPPVAPAPDSECRGLVEVRDELIRLMQAGPLPELVLGNPDAAITVVEYASMTCGHCGRVTSKARGRATPCS